MNVLTKIIFTLSLLSLAACQVDNPVKGVDLPPAILDLEKIQATPMEGLIKGQEWKIQTALASLTDEGQLQILISGNGDTLTCQNQFFRKVGAALIVPFHIGTYKFDLLRPSDTNPVTVTFPPGTDSPEYMTVVLDKSEVMIESIIGNAVKGGLTARGFDPSYPVKLNGMFQAIYCN